MVEPSVSGLRASASIAAKLDIGAESVLSRKHRPQQDRLPGRRVCLQLLLRRLRRQIASRKVPFSSMAFVLEYYLIPVLRIRLYLLALLSYYATSPIELSQS